MFPVPMALSRPSKICVPCDIMPHDALFVIVPKEPEAHEYGDNEDNEDDQQPKMAKCISSLLDAVCETTCDIILNGRVFNLVILLIVSIIWLIIVYGILLSMYIEIYVRNTILQTLSVCGVHLIKNVILLQYFN